MKYYIKAFKNFTNFNGRATRPEFWYVFLFNFIISNVLSVIDVAVGTQFLSLVFTAIVIIPSIAVGVRRMHDVGKSGWFILIPLYNIVLAAQEGEKTSNDYGLVPS